VPKTSDIDVDDLLDSTAKSDSKKKKSDTPAFEVKGEVAKAITNYKKAKKVKTTAEAKMRSQEDEIVPTARELHLEEVKKLGKTITTIKLVTPDGDEIQVDVAKQQYSKIPTDSEEELRDRFGDDYDDLFTKERDIKLTKAALKDREILKKLIQAVGKEDFAKYFEVKDHIVPKAEFHNSRFLKDDDRVSGVIDEELVKPFKVAMRG